MMDNMFQSRFLMAPDAPSGGTSPTSPVTPPVTPTEVPSVTTTEPPTKQEMTQKEIDALISGAKREGAEKLWKKNGFASEKEFDDFVTAAKKEADAKKSEAQREKDRADKAELAIKAQEERANKAEAKAEALALGVPADKADDLVMLAMTEKGETVAARIKAALENRPWFKDAPAAQVPNLSTRVRNQTSASMQAADAELEKVFGKHVAG